MIGKQKYTIDLIWVWLVFQTENGYLHLPSEKYKTSKTPHIQISEFHTVIYKFCTWSDLKTENDICVDGPNIMRSVQTVLESCLLQTILLRLLVDWCVWRLWRASIM